MNKAPQPMNIIIPISKVDEEQRMVWGYATLEEVDAHGEIIGYDASKKAFANWIGNIREMHGDRAVGKGVEIQYDDTNKGVWLGSKISESQDGENAWIKVKEGVLAGYSIGGIAKGFEMVKIGDDEEEHMKIVDYDLAEVSLVDNPACPGATLQMVKSVHGGKLQRVEKAIQADGRPVAWWERMYKYSPSQSIRKTVTVYNSDMKQFTKADFSDAGYLADIAMELSWYLRSEQYEGDTATADAIGAALKGLRAAIASELNEDETDDLAVVIANAVKIVNLKKEQDMKKSTVGAEDRDEKAEVTATAEENGRPVNDTAERAAEAGVPAAGDVVTDKKGEPVLDEDGKPQVQPLVHEAGDAGAEKTDATEETNTDESKGSKKVENAAPAEFAKSMSALLEPLTKSIGEMGAKVEKSVADLEERMSKLEGQPAAVKVAKGEFADIKKAEEAKSEMSEKEDNLQALLKQADEYAADPSKGTINERTALAIAIRKAQRATDPASIQKAQEIRDSFRQDQL